MLCALGVKATSVARHVEPHPEIIMQSLGFRISSLTLMLLFTLLGGVDVQALSFSEVPDASDLAGRSSLAFRGTVIDVRYAMASSATSGITVPYSVYTFEVDRNYRNTTQGQIVTLFQYGGWIDTERWESAAGLPTLEVGEKVAIFHNDTRQFLFASLYGDAGMRRFVWNGRQMITLSAGWTALAQDPEAAGLEAEDMHECEPASGNPTQCAIWLDIDGQGHTTPFPSDKTVSALTVEAFDQLVDQWMVENPAPSSEPPQTLGEAAFAAKLAAFMEAMQHPAPIDDEPMAQ